MSGFDTIRNALRSAATEAEVAQVADKYQSAFREIEKVDKARALIIANLKANRIWSIRNP